MVPCRACCCPFNLELPALLPLWLALRLQVIAESIKAYVAFEKKLVDALPKEERATARPIDVR